MGGSELLLPLGDGGRVDANIAHVIQVCLLHLLCLRGGRVGQHSHLHTSPAQRSMAQQVGGARQCIELIDATARTPYTTCDEPIAAMPSHQAFVPAGIK
jgi:hypothetical protein